MSEVVSCTINIDLGNTARVIVREYVEHPSRKNQNLSHLFCANGWWRIECWDKQTACPQLFATVLMVRVYDEKHQNKCILLKERLYLLKVPFDGLFHAISLDEQRRLLIIGFLPDEKMKINSLPIRLPS